MIELVEIVQNSIEMGLIYALVVLSMHLTSRIISFDDLTVEGSFALGGAVCATLLMLGWPSWLSLFCIIAAGALLGLMTGLMHTKLSMNNLMSGLVATTGVFSINLVIAGPNIALSTVSTLFDMPLPEIMQPLRHIIILLPVILLLYTLMCWFLKTQMGFLLRAAGDNPQMLTNLGKSITCYKILGLMIANGITALAGALFVQHVGFFSITASIGTMLIALAGLIMGDIFGSKSLNRFIFGAIAYQAIIALTFELQFDPAWNKLITAGLIVLLIISRRSQKKQTMWR